MVYRSEDAIKVNNVVVAHWLKYFLQARWRLRRRNCYQRNVNVTHTVAYLHFLPEFIDPENWPANSQNLNPVDFSIMGFFVTEVVSLEVPRR